MMLPKACHKDVQALYGLEQNSQGKAVLSFLSDLSRDNACPLIQEFKTLWRSGPPAKLTVDLEKVGYFDLFGALCLVSLKKMVENNAGEFRIVNASKNVLSILKLVNFDQLGGEEQLAKAKPPSVFMHFGSTIIHLSKDLKELVEFVGGITVVSLKTLVKPHSLRWSDTVLYMRRVGVDALPIVSLISFLLGLIIAFMSSVQLEQFGANIYVASLVSLAMTRELGPIMTCILISGRSGSAFAAEIGSMKIAEEVDALITMGFDTIRFMVIPKLLAAVIVVPILTLFSIIFAIAGGLVVGVTMLDLTVTAYLKQSISTLELFDLGYALFKSAVFALLIAGIGCFRGFQVHGGADAVGKSTTSAVVSGIFLIIVFDAIFSVILRYWG
jgi:phospholipid/cholesterol/gamma-HCH transport system permease protein